MARSQERQSVRPHALSVVWQMARWLCCALRCCATSDAPSTAIPRLTDLGPRAQAVRCPRCQHTQPSRPAGPPANTRTSASSGGTTSSQQHNTNSRNAGRSASAADEADGHRRPHGTLWRRAAGEMGLARALGAAVPCGWVGAGGRQRRAVQRWAGCDARPRGRGMVVAWCIVSPKSQTADDPCRHVRHHARTTRRPRLGEGRAGRK